MSSPSSSPSLSSPASLHHAPQYPLPLTQSFLYETYHPGALHLTPCTVDQYFELPFGNDDKYELVNGLLWWKGMVTHTHDEARDRNAAEINRRFVDRGYEIVVERSLHVGAPSEHASNRSNSTSTSASGSDYCTIRRPDIAVFEPGRAPNRGDLSPRSKKITFPRNYPPLLAVELTSPSTRNVDLHSKWDEYEEAGVLCYAIIDRAAKKDSSVIVGILTNGKYTKSVFRGDDVVRGSLFDQLGFSAQYLLDPPRSITEIRNSPIKKWKTTNARQASTIARQANENARQASTIDLLNKEKARQASTIDRQASTIDRQANENARQARRIAELERQRDSKTKREARRSSGSSANSNSPSKPPKHKRPKMGKK